MAAFEGDTVTVAEGTYDQRISFQGRNITPRSTNAIECTVATVRRPAKERQTKGCGSRQATLTMVFKLATQAQTHWRGINGYQLVSKVIQGVRFGDGQLMEAA